jgi:hypothetical protein
MGSSLLLKGGTSTPKNIVESFSQANNFSVGDAIRYDIPSSTWVKAQADSAENSEVAGVVSAASFNTFDLTYAGLILVSALSGVSAPVLFLDSTTAGGLTSSPPSAIGSVIKPVLTKTTNGSGYIVTNYLGTQIGGSSTVAIDEIQPVGTVVPFAGSTIPDSWLECNGNSYAVGAYPYLYSKLQYSSGDRVPAYGHVAVLTTQTPVSPLSVGTFIRQGFTNTTVRAKIIAIVGTTITVQTVPVYSSTNKNFVVNNTVFATGFAQNDEGDPFANITAVSITHFNTPDLRGRVALGVNTGVIPDTDDDFTVNTTNSAISGIYSLGSAGGQESTVANTGVGAGSAAFVTSATTTGGLIANLPPYTVVRYIIKASPYTRAAIIDGIDIPYTSLLVGDLRDGTLRPGGIGEALVFKTNDGSSGVERMRLSNDGNLLIGTTFNQPGHKFIVSGANGIGVEFLPGYISNGSVIQGVNRSSGGYTTLRFDAYNFIFNSSIGSSFLINSSGQVNIPSTVQSTSLSTGGLTLGGGLGMELNLTVGGGISAAGGITFSGVTRVTNNTPASSPTVAAFTVVGGIGANSLHVGAGGQSIAGPLNVGAGGAVNMASAIASNSTTSGALTVVGGVGIQGALYVGGITTAGGISMGGALTVGGGITAARLDLGTGVMKSGSITTGAFSANTLGASGGNQSSSVSSGDLVVVGGAGIGKNLFVGGGITAAGSLDLGSGAIRTSGSLNCGNIVSAGTFQANSLNASFNTTSTSTGSGSLILAGGAGIAGALNVGGGMSAGGGITSAGNLNLGNPRNYTSTSAYGNMIRALGFHNNTKIQLVASGEGSGTFIGNGTTAGSALLMWASEPQQTYSGSGIGNNLTASPGSAAETRQFTEQAQSFIRFTDNGSIGFHTSAVGATASLTAKVAILSTGGLDVTSGIASTSTSSGALVVTGVGGVGIGGALNVGGALTVSATSTFAASAAANVGIGSNAPTNKLEITSNTTGYSGGIYGSNANSSSYFRLVPLGTNHGVAGWANSSVLFEGVPGASGNTIIGSYYNDLVFQTGARQQRMRILPDGTLIHNGFALPASSGTVGSLSFVPSSVNPIYNRIVFGGDNTGYGLAIASQHNSTNAVTDRLVIYDNGNIKIPITTASTSTTTGALTVAGGVGIGGALYAGNSLRVVGAQNYGSSANSGIVTIGNANNSRQINLGVSDTNSVAYIEGWVPGVGGSHLVLQPSGGRVGIGTATPAQALDVVGSIIASDNITAFSDSRFKEDVKTIENALQKTQALNGVSYTDKASKEKRIGLIAQELKEVIPEVVFVNGDDQIHSVAYGNLVGLLVQAIKELNAKVDSLSVKVETLSSGGSE